MMREDDYLTRPMRSKNNYYEAVERKLLFELEHKPSYCEMISEFEKNEGNYENFTELSNLKNKYSLEKKIGVDELRLKDIIIDKRKTSLENLENLEVVSKLFRQLSQKELKVCVLRYYQDMSFKKISEKINCSESNAYEIHSKALRKMRQK
jgi:RNA polymerase sigma factor for flagellar operon FliA